VDGTGTQAVEERLQRLLMSEEGAAGSSVPIDEDLFDVDDDDLEDVEEDEDEEDVK